MVGCGKEFAVNGFWPFHGSVKLIGGGKLPRLRPRQRAQRRLQRSAHSVGERVVKHSVSRPDRRLARTRGVPCQAHARHQALPVHRRDAVRHARVAREQQPRRSVREHRRLLARRPGVHAISDIRERRAHFPAQSVVDGQPRRDPPFVLSVRREIDIAQTAIHIAAALKEHHREPEKEAGERIAERKRREHEEPVRRDPLRHIDLVAPEIHPSRKLCAPVTCETASCAWNVFCVVSRGPVIGSPMLA